MVGARRAPVDRAAAPEGGALPAAGYMPLLDDAFLRDPYPAYRRLRESAPLLRSDEFFDGAWLVSRHADVEWVLRDPRFSAQRTGGWVMRGADERTGLRGFQRLFARAMIFLDAPDHGRIRRILATAFRPADLQRLQPQIEQAVGEHLDAVSGCDRFDFVAALARPLPARVIAMLMGVGDHDRDAFVAWSDHLADFIGAPAPRPDQALRAQTALLAMARSFETMLDARRSRPATDDVLGRLIQAERDGSIRGSAELLAQCVMLLFAGHETTRHLLANGLRTLLAHRPVWERLQREPAAIPGAVRELLRYDCPVQYTGRRVATDVELHGQTLKRGDLVVALIGAANRDPARHAHPDKLDIDRPAESPLAFGQGPHVCIGAALTLMEAQAVFAQVLRRWPQLALEEPDRIHWSGNPLYRGVSKLPLQTGADRPQHPMPATAMH